MIFVIFWKKSRDHEKARTFVPRPNNFVIVNCETITLLTRGLSPDGQTTTKQATDDPRETFLRMQREFSSAQAKSDHLDDEMSCRMVREVCWWCACRASGGVHLVCAWCSACVCRQVHISSSRWSFFAPSWWWCASRVCGWVARCNFGRPDGHFWSLGRILVPFLVHFGRGRHLGPWVAGFSWFWSGFSSIFRHFDPFFTVLVGIFDENRSK